MRVIFDLPPKRGIQSVSHVLVAAIKGPMKRHEAPHPVEAIEPQMAGHSVSLIQLGIRSLPLQTPCLRLLFDVVAEQSVVCFMESPHIYRINPPPLYGPHLDSDDTSQQVTVIKWKCVRAQTGPRA